MLNDENHNKDKLHISIIQSDPYFYRMADRHSKETRSYIMSKIRSKDTKPELLVRKYLHVKGFRFRKNLSSLPGKPDIVLTKYKTVIFIHGCLRLVNGAEYPFLTIP